MSHSLVEKLRDDGSSLSLEAADAMERQMHRATNAEYMKNAYYEMLGPVALQVANGWKEKGLVRSHVSWGDGAWALTGEERAQVILDFQNAPKTEVKNFDDLPPAPAQKDDE